MTVFQDNICVAVDIFDFLQNRHTGEVLLTTSKGVYLQFPTRILQITSDSFGVTPIGIGLERYDDFLTDISPKAGDTVSVTPGRIQFPTGTLLIQFGTIGHKSQVTSIHCQTVLTWAAALQRSCKVHSAATLSAPLLLNQPQPLSLSPWCKQAQPLLVTLLNALKHCDYDSICASVGNLLGLGIGLTPSLDDVLLGMLYGLLRLAPQWESTVHLCTAIQEMAEEKTNAISAAYLTAVAAGGPFSRLDTVLQELGCSALPCIAPMMEIGSSSGSEMLFGLLLAAKLTTKG